MDELRQYYQSVGDDQNIQHFITQEQAQVQRGPEIYISTSDKVIVDNTQQQHIIVNQSAYTNQQYIIQGATVDGGQPIVYMDGGTPMLVTQIAQPINVCAALGNNIQRVVTPVVKTIDKNQIEKVQQVPVNKAVVITTNNTEIVNNKPETVTLSDGRVMSIADYKKLIAPKRLRATNPKPRGGKQQVKLIDRKQPAKQIAQAMSAVASNSSNGPNLCDQSQYQQQVQSQAAESTSPPTPQYPIPKSQIREFVEQAGVGDEYGDSIRMLVYLANEELRLITFTIPKEQCTIVEILEQIGIPVDQDTKIDPIKSDIAGINFIVSVGVPNPYRNFEKSDEDNNSAIGSNNLFILKDSNSIALDSSKLQQQQHLTPPLSSQDHQEIDTTNDVPRYVAGRLAVCEYCGYLSEDFNKCLRCKRKLPDDVKSMAATTGAMQQNDANKQQNKIACQGTIQTNKTAAVSSTMKGSLRKKFTKTRIIEQDPIVLTLSSDDEDDAANNEERALRNVDPSVQLSTMKKEPSLNDMKQFSEQNTTGKTNADVKVMESNSIPMHCRTIRIGSYRFFPPENVSFNGANLIIKAPIPKSDNAESKTIVLNRESVVKVLVNFHKLLPVVFYYTVPTFGKRVRELLGMEPGDDNYFDPMSKEESCKRIAIIAEYMSEEVKEHIRLIYGDPFSIIEELSNKEANNILLKTCPKELNKIIAPPPSNTCDIRQLLIYPQGKCGLSINTEDYMCLAQDQFLNDVIIEFYLNYLVMHLPQEEQSKVHVFSTFFYNRLTTKPSRVRRNDLQELDPNLSAAEKRHARVSKWTKNVNLFEKDFIIVPINENSHWFLAIVCFPNLKGPTTFDGKPVKIEPVQRKKAQPQSEQPSTTTTLAIKVEKETSEMEEDGDSNKDEAEGDDSELDEDDDSMDGLPEEVATVTNKTPIKQPCILIFDSLHCSSRSRVIATLRDYLTIEYKNKLGVEKVFTKDVIKGANPKVPQQTNFTDCGLYLLQYVESFFKDPIQSYHLPIKTLKCWFDELTVTKKREDISNLIKDLMTTYNRDTSCVPEIQFPTINGKLRVEEEEEGEEEEEEQFEDEMANAGDGEEQSDDQSNAATNGDSNNCDMNSESDTTSLMLCGNSSAQSSSGSFIEESIGATKPDLSEIQKHNNRETLSYLKAKRILRHKACDSSDAKKLKTEES